LRNDGLFDVFAPAQQEAGFGKHKQGADEQANGIVHK
jgi:hypothetical protein